MYSSIPHHESSVYWVKQWFCTLGVKVWARVSEKYTLFSHVCLCASVLMRLCVWVWVWDPPPVVFIQFIWYSALTPYILFLAISLLQIDSYSLEVEGNLYWLFTNSWDRSCIKMKNLSFGPDSPLGKLAMLLCHYSFFLSHTSITCTTLTPSVHVCASSLFLSQRVKAGGFWKTSTSFFFVIQYFLT